MTSLVTEKDKTEYHVLPGKISKLKKKKRIKLTAGKNAGK